MYPKKIVKSKDFSVIYNAVDRERFMFNKLIRQEVREELGIENDLALIHVGYFAYPKNQSFLVEVLEELVKNNKNVKLIFAGTGQDMDRIKSMVEQKGLKNFVLFLGWRSDIDRLMQGADMLLLPSFFEGLPIVGVEAQCSGLYTVMSNTISEEAKISEKCEFVSIDHGTAPWVNCILEHKDYDREETAFLEITKEYDLKNQSKQLLDLVK